MNRIFNADCFDVLDTLDDNSIDAVITDPPYATTGKSWDAPFNLDAWWIKINRVLKADGVAIVFADEPFSSQLVVSNIERFRYEWIWDKRQHSGAMAVKKRPLKHTEDIYVFSEQTPRYYPEFLLQDTDKVRSSAFVNRIQGGSELGEIKDNNASGTHKTTKTGYPKEVIQFKSVRTPAGEKKMHIAQKPIELMEWLVQLYTEEGQVILDPFMGSGSTGVAAKNRGREFIGVEKNADYFQTATNRLGE
jgi:site-specific DNA-methyltransferase (adenine-specific)